MPLVATASEQKTPEQAELERPRLVIKNGSLFMVLDPNGTMSGGLSTPYGLYLNDTRYLSGLTFEVNGKPLKAKSANTRDGYKAAFEYDAVGLTLGRETVIDWSPHTPAVVERLVLRNKTKVEKTVELKINFAFDFKDMFEVRGQARKAHGTQTNELASNRVTCHYKGIDGKVLTSIVQFTKPTKLAAKQAYYQIKLASGAKQAIEYAIVPKTHDSEFIDAKFWLHKRESDIRFEQWKKNNVSITCDNPKLNQVFEQAVRDLYLLKISTPRGPGFAAGLPWYSVAFGRDQIITALQILNFAPDSAKEIILLLAKYQGNKVDKFTEETPGKIMHELRTGEMARTREIPFIPYYGTIDATPLWLVLVNRYVENTGDIELARKLWPNIEAALSYLEANTPDDFLFYGKQAVDGKEPALSNQAWKDSGDSVMHKDGKLAKPPIAICEVQGYLYDAWQSGASLAEELGQNDEASNLRARAKKLKEHFKQSFWLADQNYVALAIDGTSQPCAVIASNPGHLLSSGIIDKAEALAIAERLLKQDMFSGWGIRTLSSKEKAYDPASYHNGSIWPHDNAIIVSGMKKLCLSEEAAKVITPLLEVAMRSKDKRLPELFCGYPRTKETSPKPYAVSCVPQLWCVGSVFSMVESLTGFIARGPLVDSNPQLPQGVNWLKIEIPDTTKKQLTTIEIKRPGQNKARAQVSVRQL